MKITWHGDMSFSLTDKEKTWSINVPFATAKNTVFCYTNEQVKKDKGTFDWPGEYEAKSVNWIAEEIKRDDGSKNLIYRIEFDHIKICHLGLLDTSLDEAKLSFLEDIDILIVPLGNQETITPSQAYSLIEKIEPRIVIPMLYDDIQFDTFIKESGMQPEQESELKISKAKLPDDNMIFVQLEQK